jgi:hypothetical protein
VGLRTRGVFFLAGSKFASAVAFALHIFRNRDGLAETECREGGLILGERLCAGVLLRVVGREEVE